MLAGIPEFGGNFHVLTQTRIFAHWSPTPDPTEVTKSGSKTEFKVNY